LQFKCGCGNVIKVIIYFNTFGTGLRCAELKREVVCIFLYLNVCAGMPLYLQYCSRSVIKRLSGFHVAALSSRNLWSPAGQFTSDNLSGQRLCIHCPRSLSVKVTSGERLTPISLSSLSGLQRVMGNGQLRMDTWWRQSLICLYEPGERWIESERGVAGLAWTMANFSPGRRVDDTHTDKCNYGTPGQRIKQLTVISQSTEALGSMGIHWPRVEKITP